LDDSTTTNQTTSMGHFCGLGQAIKQKKPLERAKNQRRDNNEMIFE
jgi:hypothetical protein